MSWAFAGATDRGRFRENNEDALHTDESLQLAILADGMGGYNAGEVASALAIEVIAHTLRDVAPVAGGTSHDEARLADDLRSAVQSANTAIRIVGEANPACAGMGTTVVAAVFGPQRVVIAHVGDSRAYRFRQGELRQITRDHSLLQEQVDAGMLTPEEALTAPHRNLVTRALGVESAVNVEVHGHDVAPGDLFLLCSDGLTDMVVDDALVPLLAAGGSLPEIAQSLIDAANSHGGRDNISVILVQAPPGAAAAGDVPTR